MADAAAEHLLDCRELTRRFGERVAVDRLSFHIDRGETYGLLGPNGSGKTTTISMVAGVLKADAGSVTIAGRPIGTKASRAKGAIGLVPQEVALYEDLTAAENLRFFGRLQGMSGRGLEARIARVLETVGLTARGRDRVEDYSGGMKRRANIAVGLLHEPQLLILDEPTVGVDPQSRNQILESIEVLGGEGLSVLYTTHYMEEAERLCHRVAIMDEGRLVAEGTRRELVARIGEHELVTIGTGEDGTGEDATGNAGTGEDGTGNAGTGEDGTGNAGTGNAGGDERRQRFAARCRELPTVRNVTVNGKMVALDTDDADATLPAAIALAAAERLPVLSLNVREPNLEAVFLHLTGKALRD